MSIQVAIRRWVYEGKSMKAKVVSLDQNSDHRNREQNIILEYGTDFAKGLGQWDNEIEKKKRGRNKGAPTPKEEERN